MAGKATAGSQGVPFGGRIPRIIYNDDTCTLRTAPPPHTLASLAGALDYLKGTQVDCLCWCVGDQVAYAWPSKVIENIYDLKAKVPSDYAGWSDTRDIMLSLHLQGIDYLPHFIRRAHDQGLSFVASFRMNDTHIKSYPTSNMSPDFWKTHQHYRIWDAVDGKSYYNAALDYSFTEVRTRYHDAIAEVLQMYEVDGIELDFTRSPYFFQPFEAWEKREILTQFVRDIGALLERVGKERGRPQTLILRIPSRERVLRTGGIDAWQWIQERLAPILVISELCGNFNQDITAWREACRESGVMLYPAAFDGPAVAYNADFYSSLVRNPQAPRHDGQVRITDAEHICLKRGAAQNLLAQQADGIALFNFPCWLAEGKNIMHTDPQAFGEVTSLLFELGSLDTLARKDKLYTFYLDLPIYVEANRPRRYHQTIPFLIRGTDLPDATVTLRWRWIAEKNPHADGIFRQHPLPKPGLIKVYVNDREIPAAALQRTKAPAGRIPSGFLLKTHEIVEVQLAGRDLRDGENTLAFEMPKPPHERDPYVYVYELQAAVRFA
jgi:hypothetical protein